MMERRWLPALLLAFVVIGGAVIRLADLERESLTADEMNHYFAALALQRGEPPLLPSGQEFDRGRDVTALIARLLPHASSVEQGVRLPSALFGILCLPLFAAIVWGMAGPWAAFWATLLLAIDPEGIFQSRHGRFYTYQLLLGLLAFGAAWRASIAFDRPGGFRPAWAWSIAALAAFLLATRVQVVTLTTAAAWGVYVAAAAGLHLRDQGRGAWTRSVPLQLTAAVLVLAALATVLRPDLLQQALLQARTVPYWATVGDPGPLYYYHALSGDFPLLVSLAPAIFLVVALSNLRLGLFLGAWFALPVLVHSLVLPWKGERFILLAMPAFFTAAGVAAAWAVGALRHGVRRLLTELKAPAPMAVPLQAVLVAVVALGAIMTTPAFNTARRELGQTSSPSWATASDIVTANPELAGIPLGSSVPIASLHYWTRVDFGVQKGLLEDVTAAPAVGARDGGPQVWLEPGSPDHYTGVPILSTPESIRGRFAEAGAVLIGIDSARLIHGNIEPDLRRVLEREAAELCRGTCGPLLMFHWVFETPGE